MIYPDGILVNIMNRQKMLIPTTSMPIDDYAFDNNTGNYIVAGRTIKVGDKIVANITDSQYNNGSFSCIGVLKDV